MSGLFAPRAPRSIQPAGSLPTGEVEVWAVALDPPSYHVDHFWTLLSPDEVERARRFRFDQHRRRYVVGRGALRTLLGAYLGREPRDIRFTYGPRGKPGLADGGDLDFNLSNSDELALVGFLRGVPIGVDVELVRPMEDLEPIARRFFCESETAKLLALPSTVQTDSFFNCWTRKEAYLKAVGEGLAAPLDSFEVTLAPEEAPRMLALKGDVQAAEPWFYAHFLPQPGYIGALAIEGGSWEVRTFRYPF